MDKKNVLFMAIAKGKVSTDGPVIKRYIGLGACKVLAVNPNKAQMKELLGFEPQDEPTYVGTQADATTGKEVPFVRFSFVVKTIPEKCNGIDTTQMLTIFVRNQYRKGNESGKYQVIDEYGRTAWGDEATIKAKGQIMYSNGPANITQNYRPAYVGEEDLTEFIKALVNIPNPANYVNGTWTMKTDKEELANSECRLEEIPSYFKGNIQEVKDCLTLQPDNFIQVLFGIRVGEDQNGNTREYQDVYTKVLKSNANENAIAKLQSDIEQRQANNGLTGRTYEFTPIHEYGVTETTYPEAPATEEAKDNDPLAGGESGDAPW